MNYRFALIALAGLAALPAAQAATDVGVSVQVSQPGVYGRIDIGNTRPQVINTTPVIIAQPQPAPQPQMRQAPVVVAPPQPIYMWVPEGHQRNWKKHCHRYNACNQQVYFVQDQWYNDNIRGNRHADDHEHRKHKHRDHDHHERHGDDDHGERGHGRHRD
jgi:hypothetical protein